MSFSRDFSPGPASPTNKYDRIRRYLRQEGAPDFRYRQVVQAIFRDRIGRFSQMAALPRGLREDLAGRFSDDVSGLSRVASRNSDQAEKVLYGLPDGKRVEAVALNFQKRLLGSLYGEANPRADIPRLLNLYRNGQLLLDETVTREYKLADINEGFDDMMAGRNIRGVILHDH